MYLDCCPSARVMSHLKWVACVQDSDDQGDGGELDQDIPADDSEPEDSHPPRAPSPPSSHASEEDTAEALQQAEPSEQSE